MRIFGKNITDRRIVLHAIFWTTWVVCFTFIQSIGFGIHRYFEWLMYYIITLPIFVTHTYLIAYWFLPKTFFQGKFISSAIGLFLLLILFSVIELVVSNEVVFRVFAPEMMFAHGYLNPVNIVISGIGNHFIILVFLAIKAGSSWYSSENKKEELLRLKTETELEIYRFQLQPQIILSLVEELEIISKTQPDLAPDMIIKISGFLNRFLFEAKDDLISLQLETLLIEEFLDIQTHALGSRLKSNFVVNGKLQSYVVPPLLILPLINSAIKIVYGCNNSFESTVLIKAEKKYLLYTFSFWSEKEFRIPDDNGTLITRKRLKYIYPGKHRLIENVDENFVEFSLEIFN